MLSGTVSPSLCVSLGGGAAMNRETGNRDHETPQSDTGVKRRGLFRFATLITAFTSVSAISAIGASKAVAGPEDITSTTAYVPVSEKGAPLGVATLDIESKIPPTLLPDLSAMIQDKVEPVAGVSIEEFGAVGNDPTVDNKAALDAALAAGVPLIVPAKSYRLATKLNRSFSGVRLTGLPGARIYSDNLTEMIQLGTTYDARFMDIMFESTAANPGEAGGMICSYASVKNIVFKRCKFRAAAAGVNGVKLVADNLAVEYGVENVYARQCEFIEVGRMGLEVQDHTPGYTYTKVRNVGVADSIFRDCGKVLWGVDLSFSGPIAGASSVGNKFYNSLIIAAEFAGPLVAPVALDNEFINLADTAQCLSFTNGQDTALVSNASIERNRSLGRSGAGARFWNLIDGRMSNNTLLVKGQVHFRDCQRLVSQGDVYDSTGRYALWVEHAVAAKECSYNVWRNANLITTGAGAFSCARFQGTAATRNRIESSRLSRVAGTRIDQISGAAINQIIGCQRDASPYQPARTHALKDADKTLGLEDIDGEALIFTGILTATRVVNFPPTSRAWRVRNATTQTLKLTAGGFGTTVTAGASIYYALDNQNASHA